MSTDRSSTETAAVSRVLLLIEATNRIGAARISDMDLARLAYFTDAFAKLWGLEPLDRYRLKSNEPRSLMIRRALDRLVASGVVVPSSVQVSSSDTPYLTANYRIDRSLARPGLEAIAETTIGRREIKLVDEVVFASAGLLDGHLDEALRMDAGFSDSRVGPNDLIDLGSETSGTSQTATRFRSAVSSRALVEAELTHLYMAYLERTITGE